MMMVSSSTPPPPPPPPLGKTTQYVMGYSAQTKPANLRDVLESKLEKKRKNLLGPPSGKKMFLFVDVLNLPALETYGAQPPNELLRQMIDQVIPLLLYAI